MYKTSSIKQVIFALETLKHKPGSLKQFSV